tara:strand:- start:667 stop:936 length:270 start_codon:yes stop_codon:yes gene_type:complete
MKITKQKLKEIIKEELQGEGRRYRHAGERLAAHNEMIRKEKVIMAAVNSVLSDQPSEEDAEVARFLINIGQQILGHWERSQTATGAMPD